jgi:hypothetical protein
MNLGKIYQVVIDRELQPGGGYVLSLADPSSISLAQIKCESLQHTPVETRANVTVIYLLE